MSIAGPCQNATAPVNITSTATACTKICEYTHKYALSDCSLQNKGKYLQIDVTKTGNTVFFNNARYNVKEVRLYQPSLHTYNSKHATGELIIHHVSAGNNLLVCIPLNVVAQGASKSARFFSQFLPFAPQKSGESSAPNVSNWGLDNVIPVGAYYFYQGTAPYPPCTGTYNFIVFDLTSAAFMGLDSAQHMLAVVEKNTLPVHGSPQNGLYYNKSGTGSLTTDIYIDCQPVGDDDDEDEEPYPITPSSAPTFEDIMSNPFFAIAVGAVALIVFKKLYTSMLNKL